MSGKSANKANLITLSKGGLKERKVKLDSLPIPDCWHIGRALGEEGDKVSGQTVLDCWHLAHDLKRELLERTSVNESLLMALERLYEMGEFQRSIKNGKLVGNAYGQARATIAKARGA